MIIGLKHCDSNTLASYTASVAQYIEIADALGVPEFSKTLRADLLKILGDVELVRLVEALTRIGNFADAERYRSLNTNVKAILNHKGIRLSKGKRPAHPGLEPMVERLAPVIVALGVSRATGEYSQLVGALRAIANEIGITGDPRDLLRRATKLGRQHEQQGYRALLEAFARGIEPDQE